jgi:DNA segregation ATPase FtsK/SpoIIIE-like protein
MPKSKETNKANLQKSSKREELIQSYVQIIERTLRSFGIYSRVVEVNILENIVHFNIEIALGTKIDEVLALKKDLALALASPEEVEIEAPIKGRSLIGLKVPLRTNPNLEKEKYKIIRIVEKEPAENIFKSFFRLVLKITVIILNWLSDKLMILESKI